MKIIKNLRYFLGIFLLPVFFCISCAREPEYDGRDIFIQNQTEDTLFLSLFTKRDIGGLYCLCEGECGAHRDTEYVLPPNPEGKNRHWYSECIFITSDNNVHPSKILLNVFDSIYISTANKDRTLIKFTSKKFTGYSDNIFSESSAWNTIKTSGLRDKSIVHYKSTFLIIKDKLIIKP